MKKLLSTVVALSIALTSLFGQQDPQARKILDAMSAKYRQTPAFKATFDYIMENETDDIYEKFQGTIFVKGDLYKLLMAGQEMRFDGKNIWSYSKETSEVTVSPREEEDEISISNIFEIYKTGYKYVYFGTSENGKSNLIDLVPNDRNLSFFKIRMEIDANTSELKTFKVFDKSATQYFYVVTSYVSMPTLKENSFTFSPTELQGKELIDMR